MAMAPIGAIVRSMTQTPRAFLKMSTMTWNLVVLGMLALCASPTASAETPGKAQPKSPRMFVAPSSTTVAMGKASLVVAPLTREANRFVGGYKLKVTPYFFKSESGTLELEAPSADVARLMGGKAVKFTGKATNAKNGKVKVITGNATPSANDRGSVIFSVETENGQMKFKTSYEFKE